MCLKEDSSEWELKPYTCCVSMPTFTWADLNGESIHKTAVW